MESIVIEFNADLWVWKCLEDLVSYKTLRLLVEDKGAVESYLSSRGIISLGGGPAPPEFIEALFDRERQSISNLVAHFGSQTIVTLCTTLEVANKEFFVLGFLAIQNNCTIISCQGRPKVFRVSTRSWHHGAKDLGSSPRQLRFGAGRPRALSHVFLTPGTGRI